MPRAAVPPYTGGAPNLVNPMLMNPMNTAALSAANTAAWRYNSGTQTVQVSINGAAYADIGLGSSSTLQAAYNAGQTIACAAVAGAITQTPVSITNSVLTNTDVLQLTRSPGAPQGGNGLKVAMGANTSGAGVLVTATGVGNGINVVISGVGPGIQVTNSGGTSIDVLSTAGSSVGINVFQQLTASGAAAVLTNNAVNNADALTVTKNPAGAQSGVGVNVAMGANTTGAGVAIAMTALSTGAAISLSGGTSLFLESTDGSTSAVSGAATGRLRYNNGTARWESSVQGGAWAALGGGASINPTTSIITIGAGLGAVNQIVGPSDQTFAISASANNGLSVTVPTAGFDLSISGGRYVELQVLGGIVALVTNLGIQPAGAGSSLLGAAAAGWGALYLDYTNTAGGTTGNQTINKPSGRVNFAAAATQLTVTNSLVTAKSQVIANCVTNDATAFVQNCVASAGSFVITLGAAATAETAVAFVVIGAD